MKYEVIGDLLAPSLFTIDGDGRLSVASDLKLDDASSYDLRILAYDSANPGKSAMTVVTITVSRNENGPVFTKRNYIQAVSETLGLGRFVIQINATDRDGDAVKYYITGENDDPQFFYIDPDVGSITVKKLLTEGDKTQYNLKITASDQGSPERREEASVQINVRRDIYLPEFEGDFDRTIDVNHPVNDTPVVVVRAVDRDRVDELMYELTGVYPAQHFFWIDNRTGMVRVNQSLKNDNLRMTTYSLQVEAYDLTYPENRNIKYISITVNRNTNAPRFQQTTYEKTITESYPLVTEVLTLAAADPDGDNLTYSLLDTDGQTLGFFFIEESTGILMLKKSLEEASFTSFTMQARAYDNGRPVRYAETTITINVHRNQFLPQWESTPYKQNVNEDTRNGTKIYEVRATDQDQQESITYEAVGVDPATRYFAVSPTSGNIYVINDLKLDRGLIYTLRLAAYDSANPQQKVYTDLILSVNRNINSPVFLQRIRELTIFANTALGATIATVSASDQDGDEVKYSIASDNRCQAYYYMNPDSGTVTLKKLMEDEAISRFECTIEGHDQGYPEERSDSMDLIVNVQRDVEIPVFGQETYLATVSESQAINTSVASVRASLTLAVDSIQYEIVGEYPAPDFFHIETTTGLIYLNRDLREDSLQLSSYTLRVEAFDRATPDIRGQTRVTISVRRNENKPIFSSTYYTATISADMVQGVTILNVTATDADESDNMMYSLSGRVAEKYFYIDPDFGAISLKTSILEDTNTQYTMTIRASDRSDTSGQFSVSTVVISVPRDQNPPVFQGTCNKEISENIPVNTTIVTVRAWDADQKSPIEYHITGLYPAENFFTVNPRTGVIYVQRVLKDDSLKSQAYQVQVVAFDSSYPDNTVSTICDISVIRNANAPRFDQASYTARISEDYPVGNDILTFEATDADNDVLRYTLVGSPLIQTYFYLSPDNGILTLRKPLAASPQSEFTFVVMASDQRTNEKQTTASVSVIISRDQLPPSFNNAPYTADVSENRGVDQSVTKVFGTDPDQSGTLLYEIRGVPPAPNFFYMDNTTGIIYVKRPLNTETATTYTLVVVVKDTGSPEQETSTTVTIAVHRNEYAPRFFPSQYTVAVSEHDPIGTNITRVSATDQDLPGPKSQITYNIVGERSAPEFFYIHPSNGDLMISRKLTDDPERTEIYVVQIQARDQGSPVQEGTAVVLVTVTRNGYTPVFVNPEGYTQTIAETFTPSLTVLTVKASDGDSQGPNSQITYSILSNEQALMYFAVNPTSGAIALSQSLEGSDISSFNLTVQASDSGIPPRTTIALVRISVNTDQNKPEFEQMEYRVGGPLADDTPVATPVIQVKATDNDCPVTYDIVGDGTAEFLFAIDDTTGWIRVKEQLTLDTALSYVIRLVASDSCNPIQKSVALVYVSVSRNGDQPRFGQAIYTVNITETVSVGKVIMSVQAQDRDEGLAGSVSYTIDSGNSTPNNVGDYFYVNPKSGSITVIGNIDDDPEDTNRYILRIEANDQGIPVKSDATSVYINVARNLNRPMFVGGDFYEKSISENRPVGDEIIRLTATDADQDQVTYTLLDEDARSFYFFSVHPTSGAVTVQNSLLEGLDLSYTLKIVAADNGDPQSSSTAILLVSVLRNPNGPQFPQTYYNTTISEYFSLRDMVITVQATDNDPDSTNSGRIRYRLESGAETPYADQYFFVSETTGVISVSQALDQDSDRHQTYYMRVIASDQGIPPRSVAVQLAINVLRNQFNPVFSQDLFNSTVPGTASYGQPIITVTATDADSNRQPNTPNSDITYELIADEDAEKLFGINPKSGLITVTQPLINVKAASTKYELTVMARDGGNPSRSGTTNVIIRVLHGDSLLGVLGFQQPLHLVEVPEDVPLGYVLTELSIVNIDANKTIQCTIIDGNINGKFAVTSNKTICQLSVQGDLDRETLNKYSLKINVAQKENRKKRQAEEGFRLTEVVINVMDVNDNPPVFVYPNYPKNDQGISPENVYFMTLHHTAKTFTLAGQVQAMDLDLEENGNIEYNFNLSQTNPDSPFYIDATTGDISNTRTFRKGSPEHYRLKTDAVNKVADTVLKADPSAEVIINLVYRRHEMIMIVADKKPEELEANRNKMVQLLQQMTGIIVIITDLRPYDKNPNSNTVDQDDVGTEIWFVAVDSETYRLIERDDIEMEFLSLEAQQQIKDSFSVNQLGAVETIQSPDIVVAAFSSYTDESSNPWIALVVLAAIIILCCIVGMIVICFTHTRYQRYLRKQYYTNVATTAHSVATAPPRYAAEPVFLDPPSFLKEYETQSLAMYVPFDEPIQEMGEVNMSYRMDSGEGGPAMYRVPRSRGAMLAPSANHRVDQDNVDNDLASINPIYQSVDIQGRQHLDPSPSDSVSQRGDTSSGTSSSMPEHAFQENKTIL